MMTWFQKRFKHLSSVVLLVALFACNQTQRPRPPKLNYTAYLKGDTAIATLQESKSLFRGVLEIRHKTGYKDSGNVEGFVKGDTLMGTYHFQHYGLPIWKKNPIIFLRQKGKLIMGDGVVKYTMGIPHYNSHYPVDYADSTHFVFRRR